MKQIVKVQKTGKVFIEEVPLPTISDGMVLIANCFSALDMDSEASIATQSDLHDLNPTFIRKVDFPFNLIDEWTKKNQFQHSQSKFKIPMEAIGMSSSGIVIESKDTKGLFKKGDRVACGGLNLATHSEYIALPEELVVKIPPKVNMEAAAFSMIGTLCLESIQSVKPALGKKIAVIGLDLRGLIICQLLKASGCEVTGIEESYWHRDYAKEIEIDHLLDLNSEDLMLNCLNLTQGSGFDEVIFVATHESHVPVSLISEMIRYQGNICIVGPAKLKAGNTDLLHSKALNIKHTGTSNTLYQNSLAHSMEARTAFGQHMTLFLSLLERGRIKMDPIITHVFNLWEIQKAYSIVLKTIKEPYIGMLIKYLSENIEIHPPTHYTVNNKALAEINIGWTASNHNQINNTLVHYFQSAGASLDYLVLQDSLLAKTIAKKFKFNHCSTNYWDILKEDTVNVVYISDIEDYYPIIRESLKSDKPVLTQLLPANNEEELSLLMELKASAQQPLMPLFYRRFDPKIRKSKALFENLLEPLVIQVRAYLEYSKFSNNPLDGGSYLNPLQGSIASWIDTLQFITDAKPVSVSAKSIQLPNQAENIIIPNHIVIRFSDNSIGNITLLEPVGYHTPEEQIEIFSSEHSVHLNGANKGKAYSKGKVSKIKGSGNGMQACIHAFLDAIEKGQDSPISFQSIITSIQATFKVMESLNTGQEVQVIRIDSDIENQK